MGTLFYFACGLSTCWILFRQEKKRKGFISVKDISLLIFLFFMGWIGLVIYAGVAIVMWYVDNENKKVL